MASSDSNAPETGKGSSPMPGAPPRRLNLAKIGVIALIIIALAFVAGMWPRSKARAALRSESNDSQGTYVTVLRPAPGTNTQRLTLPAEVRAYAEAPVYARASGYLKKFYADIGQQVKEGDLLAEIETPELDRQIEQTRAQLAETEATLALAKTTAERWQGLLKTASVSEQETAEKTAELEMRGAKVNATRAELKRLEELAGFKRVLAPFDGKLTLRNVDMGELIQSGTGRVLFRVAQTGKLRVFVRVPQASAYVMDPGQEAKLFFTEMPSRLFPAKIVRTAGVIDAESRTLLTELEVDNAKGDIVAGAYAQVQFQLAADPSKLVLPPNTLLFRPEGIQVGVVGDGDKVELRSVTLGKDYGTLLEILSGIQPSDRIILNPPDSLVAGEVVRVIEPQTREKGQ